jgi:hypothetical protein
MEHCTGFRSVGNEVRWIARASRLHLNRDVASRHFARRFDDFQNRVALPVA